jgi:bacterial/archaeal transporter family protein
MDPLILLALAAMVLFGLVDFLFKKAIIVGINGEALLFYSMLIAALPFGLMCFIHSIPIKLNNPLLSYSLLIGALMFIGTISLLAALKIGEASIVVPIGRLGFVVTAVCAFIFLNETITITKILGILSAVIAIFLLSRK